MDSLKYYTISSNLLQKKMGFRQFTENHTVINVKTVMHFSEMLICLVLLSWYSPTLTVAVHVTRGCLLDFSRILTRPLSVFLISNAIIVAVAVLSGEKGTDSSNYAETKATPELQTLSTAGTDIVAVEVTVLSVGTLINKQVADSEEDQGSTTITEEANDAAGEEEVRKNPVEDLSTEEFNRTVEKYIARTKSFLYKDRLDDISSISRSAIDQS